MAPPSRPPDIRDTAARVVTALTTPHPAAHPAAKAPPPVPWWMLGPAALQKQATTQAQAYWAPVLDEYHAQQREAARQAQANLAGVQKLIEAVKAEAQGLGGGIAAAFQHGANADYGSSDFADQARQSYADQGAAYGNIGNVFGAEAGNAGEAQYLNAVQDSNKIARDLLNQINEITGKIPQTAHDIYGELVDQQTKYKAGVTSQAKQQAADYNQAYNRALQTAKFYTDSTHVLYVVADTPQGPQIVEAKGKNGKPITTNGLSPYEKAQVQARAQASQDTNSYRQAQIGLSQQRIAQGDQRIAIAQQKANKKAKPKPPTAAVIKAGWKTITDSYYHPIGSTRRLTVDELDKIIQRTNQARLATWKKTDPAKRPANPPTPITRDKLNQLPPALKRALGIAGTETPAQDVYIALVHSGIPPRKAWTMVRKYYPGFGPDYFSGGQPAAPTAPPSFSLPGLF